MNSRSSPDRSTSRTWPAFLPSQVVRTGDTWRIPRKGAQALLGDPYLQGEGLIGKLDEIRKEVNGPRMVASITVSGKIAGPAVETTVNAEALFTFPVEAAAQPARKKTLVPAHPDGRPDRGPGGDHRAEAGPGRDRPRARPGPAPVPVEPRADLAPPARRGRGGGPPPTVASPPDPTEDNSWLSLVEPSPADTRSDTRKTCSRPTVRRPRPRPNTTLLIRTRREGRDMLQVEFSPKTLSPEDLRKELREKYGALKMEVMKGEEAWLPEADWPGDQGPPDRRGVEGGRPQGPRRPRRRRGLDPDPFRRLPDPVRPVVQHPGRRHQLEGIGRALPPRGRADPQVDQARPGPADRQVIGMTELLRSPVLI